MILDYFNIAWKNVRKRKLRSWLTIVGIVIAVATLFTLVSLSLGLENAVNEQFRVLGTDKFFIQPKGQLGGPGTGGAVSLKIEDVNTVEKVPGVKDISYYTAGNIKIEFNDETRYALTIGLPLEHLKVYEELGSYKAEEGKLLGKGDEGKVMIGSQYLHNNFFSKPLTAGEKITINEQEFRIMGVLESIGNLQDDRLIYMPYDNFKGMFNTSRIDFIMVQVSNPDNLKTVAASVEKKLRSEREVTEETQDFTVLTPEELLNSFGTILNIITGFLLGVAAISLIVGAVGITNTMFASVLERTRDIGIMKSVGAKNSDVLLIFLIESGFLGLVGGTIGILAGMGISKAIEAIAVQSLATNLLDITFPLYLIIGSLAFAFFTGAISGVWPAYRASKTNPVDALRYE